MQQPSLLPSRFLQPQQPQRLTASEKRKAMSADVYRKIRTVDSIKVVIKQNSRLRLDVLCIGEEIDLTKVEEVYQQSKTSIFNGIESMRTCLNNGLSIHFFDFGVVAFLGDENLQLNCEEYISPIRHAVIRLETIVQESTSSLVLDRDYMHIELDDEQSECTRGTSQSHIEHDTVYLKTSEGCDLIDGVIYALSQSVKLGAVETITVSFLDQVMKWQLAISLKGRLPISRTDCLKKLGVVSMYEASIQRLHGILDLPDSMWHAPDSVVMCYQSVIEYICINQRLSVLRTKTDTISKTLSLIQSSHNVYINEIIQWIVTAIFLFDIAWSIYTTYKG